MSSQEAGNSESSKAESGKRYRPEAAVRALLPKLNFAKRMKKKGKAGGHNHPLFVASKLEQIEKLIERRIVIKNLFGIMRNNISNLESGLGKSANFTIQLNQNFLDLVKEAQFTCVECKKLFKKRMAQSMVERIRGDANNV